MPQRTLKNSYSTSSNTFNAIEKVLREHKARSIMFDYANDDSGHIIAMSFVLDVGGKRLSFRMPARIEQVEQLFLQRKKENSARFITKLTETERDQAYRTAWACIRDWLSAQFALSDIGAVEVQEIFLPYLINSEGLTFYQAMQERQFALPVLPAPHITEE